MSPKALRVRRDRRAHRALQAAVRAVTEPLERRILLSDNSTLATARDIDPTAVALQHGAQRLAVVDEPQDTGSTEYYRFTLAAGQKASIALSGTDTFLSLLNASGGTIATGLSSASDLGDQVIANFSAPTAGTYFIGAYSDTTYDLYVTRGATIESGQGFTGGTAQDISHTGQVLGGFEGAAGAINLTGDEQAWLTEHFGDAEDFSWDIYYDGSIEQGTDDAFDGGLVRSGFPRFNYGQYEEDFEEIVLGPFQQGPVSVARKIFVPEEAEIGFARFLEIVTNTSDSTVTHTLRIDSELGSDLATQLVATSSGGTALSTSDNWVVTDDGDGVNDPAIVHVFAGPGGLRPSAASLSGDELSFSYDLTLAPGETRVIMHFAAQSRSRDAAIAKAGRLESLFSDAMKGMDAAERAAIVNFQAGTSGDFYAIMANAGDALSITTQTLDAEVTPGQELDLLLELYDPAGNLVASNDNGAPDGRNALITHTATMSGRYSVRVRSLIERQGQYSLAVAGATGAAAGPAVIGTSITDGQTVEAFPQSYQVRFSSSLLTTGLVAGALRVNGIAASSVFVSNGNTLYFTITGAQNGNGTYNVTLDAGAAKDLAGLPTQAFASSFQVDGPDLVTSVAAGPAAATHGQMMSLTWTVTNQGSRASITGWTDYIYVSDDPVLGGADQFVGSMTNAGPVLAPGGSYARELSLSLPNTVNAGARYLLFIADGGASQGESNDGNNVRAVPITINTPNLTTVSATAPAAVAVGQAFNIEWTVQNTGDIAAAAGSTWFDYLYFSTDATFGAGDVLITNTQRLNPAPLAPAATYTASRSATITGSGLQLSGPGYLLFTANGNGGLGETTRNDNTYALPVTVAAPDLTVSDGSIQGTVPFGQLVPISWTVENIGAVSAAGNWFDQVYLSLDDTFGTGDFALLSQPASPAGTLDPGESHTFNASVSVPSYIGGPGNYHIIVRANAFGIAESNRSNNDLALPVTLVAPDMAVTSVTAPTTVGTDQNFTVSWTVQNLSPDVAAGADWYDAVYLSRDAVLDNNDEDYSSRYAGDSTPLAPGASYSATQQLYLDSYDVDAGPWYLIVEVDSSRAQRETDESNNTFVVPITVDKPDLVVSSATAPPAINLGDNIAVSWTVTNGSESATALSGGDDYVVLSTDEYFDWDDYFLDDFSTSGRYPLAPGASYTLSANIEVWEDAPGGEVYMLFIADGDENLGEGDERNNTRAVPITIAVPDLLPVAFTAPPEVVLGAPAAFSWTVHNQGNTGLDSGAWSWSDGVYVSDDPKLDFDKDTFVGRTSLFGQGVVDPGEEYSLAPSYNIPTSVLGSRYFIFVADSREDWGEVDERNNTLTVPVTVVAPDLSLSAATAPAAGVVGSSIALTWDVTNIGAHAAMGSWLDRVYLSADPFFDGSDTFLSHFMRPTTLPAGGSYTQGQNVTLPANAAPGSRYLVVLADGSQSQGETNEGNNSFAVPIVLNAPDLIVSNVTGVPPTAVLGTSLDVSFTVRNTGAHNALQTLWYDSIYISSDTVLDGSDTFVDRRGRSHSSLPAGESYTAVEGITLPPTAAGNRFLLVVTDRFDQASSGNNNRQGETSEANNTFAVPIELFATDLSVTGATAPASAATGKWIDVSYTVRNLGTTPAPADWLDGIYLSTDSTLGGGDTLITSVNAADYSPLAPGALYTINQQITIPAANAGNYFLLFAADRNNQQGETNENNNVRALAFTVLNPDLVPESLNVPGSLSAGQSVDVSWTVRNQGTVTAWFDWYDSIYLSTDTVLTSGDTRLAAQFVGDASPVLPDATYSRTQNISIPGSLQPGNYHLILSVDRLGFGSFDFQNNNRQRETVEANNELVLPISVGSPDLALIDANAPTSASQDEEVTLSWTARNDGDGSTVTNWYDEVYLSTDETFGEGDVLLAQRFDDSTVLPGESYSASVNAVIPAFPDGQAYALFLLDRYDSQGESNESNNSAAIPIQIGSRDLAVGGVSGPASASSGQSVAVSWTLTNNGSAPLSGSWTDAVYLSTDDAAGDDTLLGEFPITTTLAAGQSITRTQSVTLPSSSSGTFRFVVATDVAGSIAEGDEANNSAVASNPILITQTALPNLQVGQVTLAVTEVELNAPFTVHWTVLNTGAAATSASSWRDHLYLSADQTLDDTDLKIGDVQNPSFLNAGEGYASSAVVQATGVSEGDYYVLVRTDATLPHRVVEANEDDNTTAGPSLHVSLPPPPDMVVASVQAPEIAFSGQPMAMTYRAVNNGPGRVLAGSWQDRIYLSADDQLDAQDTLLTTVSRQRGGSLSDSAPVDVEYTVNIAPSLPVGVSGTFHVFVLTDATNRIDEFAFELNNSSFDPAPVTINLTPPPDLELESFAAPSEASAGRPFSVSYSVGNFGATATPNQSWSDALYLSTDEHFDPAADLRLATQGVFFENGLDAGSSYTRSRSLTAPANLGDGTYYLFAVADVDNIVFELNNANNVLATPSPIVISSDPPDLEVASVLAPATATAGGALALSWTVANRGEGDTIAATWRDQVFLSLDDVPGNADDRALTGFGHSGLLAAGQSYTADATVQIPWDVSGTVRVYVLTDSHGDVFEGAGEANNASAPIELEVTRFAADLQLDSAALSQVGGRLRFEWSLTNLGPGITPESHWHDGIYLSVDDTFGNADDTLLRHEYHGGRLNVGGGCSAAKLLDIPREFNGTYHFFVEANATSAVDEGGSRANNVLLAGVFDTSTLRLDPDLVVHGVDAPATATAGQEVSIGWTVRNTGDAIPLDGPLPPELADNYWYDNIYLSRDEVFDPASDTFLGQAATHRSALRAGAEGDQAFQQYERSAVFTMPRGQTGTFYVFVLTDRNRAVSETDEGNNAGSDPEAMSTSLPLPADLTVGTITIPANAVVGSTFGVTYELENLGPNNVVGSWTDRLFLSVDDTYSVDDVPLSVRSHSQGFGDGFIAAGGSATYTAGGRLAAAVPGDYYVVLRTDVYNAINEASELNNFGASLTSFTLSVPTLDLADGSDSVNVESYTLYGALSHTEYFALNTVEGQTIALDGQWNFMVFDPFDPDFDRSSQTTAYVALNRIPSPFDYDFAEESLLYSTLHGGSGNRLVIPRTEQGTYYIRLDVRDTTDNYRIFDGGGSANIASRDDMDLVATVLPFSITQLAPGRAGNSGLATFEVVASDFDICTKAELLLDGQVVREAVDLHLDPEDQSRGFVRFDLSDLAPGTYELRVISEDGESDTQQVQITLGTGPHLAASADGPARVRLNRDYVFYVNYGNNGDADGYAPLLLVENLDGNRFSLSHDGLAGAPEGPRTMQLLGISQDGPAGILRPGTLGSIPLYFSTAGATGDWRVTTITADDPRAINFTELAAEIRPAGVDDEQWATVQPRLEALVGSTWGSYVRALSDVATELASSGLRTPDMDIIFEALYLKANLGIKAPVAKGVVVGEPQCDVVPGATVRAIASDGRVLETVVADDQSRFTFRDLAPGTYDLMIDADGYARTFVSDVTVAADNVGWIKVHIHPEATIRGSIDAASLDLQNDEFHFAAHAAGQDGSQHVYAARIEGDQFTIPGLPAGEYDVRIRSNGFLVETIHVTVGQGQAVDLGEISLAPAAAVSGTILHATGGILPQSLVVSVSDLSGNVVQAVLADADGNYRIARLDAGTYRLRAAGMESGFSSEAQVIVVEGEQVENVDLTIEPGATIAGTVTDAGTGQQLAGAVVYLSHDDGSRIIQVTDAEGGYSVTGLPLGTYSIELQVTGPGARAQVEVTDLRTSHDADLSVTPVAAIEGRLTMPGGAPVAGGQVQLLRDGVVIAHAEADSDGNYVIRLLQGGTYSLTAGIGDGTASFAASDSFTVIEGQRIVRDFTAGTATANVSFAFAGTAVVTLSQVHGSLVAPLTITEANNGSISLSGLAAGNYEVDVAAGRFSGKLAFAIGDGATLDLNVPLTLQAVLSGTISDGSGAPLAGATIALLNPATGRRYFAISLADGTYSIPRVQSGTYDVSVSAPGKAPLLLGGVSINGESTLNRSLSDSTGAVTGRLVDPAGRTVGEGNVTLLDAAGHVIGMTAVGVDGRFAVDAAGTGLTLLVFAQGYGGAQLAGQAAGSMGDVTIAPTALVLVPIDAAALGDGGGGGWDFSTTPDVLRPTFFEAFFSDYVSAPAPTIGSLPSPVPIECVAQLEAAETLINELQQLRQRILSEENYFDELKSELIPLFALESLAALGKAAEIGLVIYQVGASLTTATIQMGANGAIGTSALMTGLETQVAQALTHAQNLVTIISAAVGGIRSGIDAARQAMAGGSPQTVGDRIGAVVGLVTDILGNATTIVTYLTQAAEKLAELASGVSGDAASQYLGKVGTILSAISAVNTIIQLADGDGGEFYKESLRVYGLMTSSLADVQQAVLQYEQKLAQYPAVRQALLDCINENDGNNDNNGDGDGNGGDGGNDSANEPLGPPTPPPSPSDPSPYDPQPVQSSDPNDIVGPEGFGAEGWVGAASVLPYMIRFENQASASGAAQRVTITHQLDADLDFRTFRVDDFGWGDLRIELPGNAGFHQGRVDLPDEMGFDVDVTATIDTVTGLATWILQAVDPATGEAPEDALLGFLPPNDAEGAGEGFVTYTVKARRDTATATRIDARATIIFDTNEPIDTPPIFNTLDAGLPSSSVNALPAQTDSEVFLVSWSGADDAQGSGVASFDIYVSVDGGAFSLWLGGTQLTEAMYDGLAGHAYAFFSVARDHAGNTELPPSTPEAQTTVAGQADILVDAGEDASTIEGDALLRSISFSDPAADGPWLVTIDYGDGSDPQVLEVQTPGSIELSHVYAENGSFIVSVTVENSGGTLGSGGFDVSVANAAPVVEAGPDQSASEGAAVLLNGSFTDAGAADTHAVHWDFGDGTTADGTLMPVHAYADDGAYSVTLTVTDDDGGSTSDTMLVSVANVAPTAVLSNDGPGQAGEQVTISFAGAFDPSTADTTAGFIYSFDLDGDGVYEISGASPTVTHAFETGGEYQVSGRIADKDGDFSQYTTTVVIEDDGGAVAPVFESLTATSPVAEGSAVTLAGSFIDPNLEDAFTLNVDWGDGTVEQFEILPGQRAFQAIHEYADDPDGDDLAGFTIAVTLTDSAGLTAATSTTSVVNNAAPALADVVVAPPQMNEGDTATISGSIIEPGKVDALSLTIDWGDGSTVETFDYPIGTASFSESHAYAQSGVYDVILTIADDDGGSSQLQVQVTVANAPPTATFGNDGPIDEGQSATISFTDPVDSAADTAAGFMYAFDLDNDGVFEVTTPSSSITSVFTRSGTFTVRGRIHDVDGDYTEYTTDVTVNDVAPVIDLFGAPQSDEAATYELSLGSVTDPGDDVVTGYTIHWGDGTSQSFNGSPTGAVLSHVFSDGPAQRVIRIDLLDEDGAHADAGSIVVNVVNLAPTASLAGSGAAEGSPAGISFSGQFDPSLEDSSAGFTYSFDANNDGDFEDAGDVADSPEPAWSITFPDNGSYAVRGRIKDKDGGFTDYTTTLTITNSAPSADIIGAPAAATEGDLISLSSLVVDAGALDTFTYAWSVTRDGQPFAGGTAADFDFTPTDEGSYVVSLIVTDDDGAASPPSARTINVLNAAPVLVASSAATSAQYSDAIAPVLFTASDAGSDVLTATTSFSTGGGATFVAGLPAGLTLTPGAAGQWTLGGTANLAPGSYVIRLTVSDGDGGTAFSDVALTVSAENAAVDYTGTMLATTESNRSGKATLILAATVRDGSLTSGSDTAAGDVRNARVTFRVYNAMTDALVATIPNVAVGLIDPSDSRTGAAVYEWETDIGNADSAIYRVVAFAGDRYVGETIGDFVTVAKPLNGAISGSAYLINTASAGLLAGTAGQRTDIAYSVISTRNGAKGSVVMRIRRMESDGLLHTYQVKSNAILTVTTDPATGLAVFEARAAIQDVTFTGRPISIDGNALLRITVTDGGTTAPDRMGATLWHKDGGLYFSSLWDGVRTSEDDVDGGDIKVS